MVVRVVADGVSEDLREMHTGHGPSVVDDPYDHIELAAETARRG